MSAPATKIPTSVPPNSLDEKIIEAFRVADDTTRAVVLNFLMLFGAWEHPHDGGDVIIKQCLANLNLPPATTYAEAETLLHMLAKQASEKRR